MMLEDEVRLLVLLDRLKVGDRVHHLQGCPLDCGFVTHETQ